MGSRGPKPRPVEVLRLQGSHHQYDRRGEVEIVDGEPVCPDWIPAAAIPHWDFWVNHLRNQSIVSPAWYVGLAQWVTAISEWEELEQACIVARMSGAWTIETDKGAIVSNPVFAMRDKVWDRVLKIGKEFGYTPSSKTSIRTETGPPKNRKGYIKRA